MCPGRRAARAKRSDALQTPISGLPEIGAQMRAKSGKPDLRGPVTVCGGPGSAVHRCTPHRIRDTRGVPVFHNRASGFHKRKAAGWGPGGSRTSAIVSGGWECDRRR